jgi:GTPase Era involved in 16S rRNA processing
MWWYLVMLAAIASLVLWKASALCRLWSFPCGMEAVLITDSLSLNIMAAPFTGTPTSLVIVDIPGINEANSTIYKKYVVEKWGAFDCVVVVMDARQGINTAEQVQLLEFVNQNLRDKKNLPVIILGNKVDDPDDEEQAVLVSEICDKVSEVFSVTCREEALEEVLQAAQKSSMSQFESMLSGIGGGTSR